MTFAAAPANASYLFGYSGVGGDQELIINGTTIIQATTTGWYSNDGNFIATNPNYIVGDDAGVNYRDFFVFSLNGVSGPVTSAIVSLYNPSTPYNGFSGSLATYTLHQLTTTPSPIDFYAAIIAGVGYGSTDVTAASNGQQVAVSLNSFALAAIQSSEGGSFAVGGTLVSEISAVPIPSGLPMFGVACIGLYWFGLCRRHCHSNPIWITGNG